MVVGLIRLSYRDRWGGCMKGPWRIIRRLWRQTCRAADRRRKYKVVQVHGLWLRRRDLHVLLRRLPQLLRDAARCGPGRGPRARSRRWHQFAGLRKPTQERLLAGAQRVARRGGAASTRDMAEFVPSVAIELGSPHVHSHHTPR
jgi:hypothetical protein